jgi:glycosyltransferase involved in cell wall biosynthesis
MLEDNLKTPNISVIVPVYKVEQYLSRCIDSILAQTYNNFELILVDDGSPDRSGSICDEYAESHSLVRVIHKENGGVSSARNAGIKEATGVWLCFVDSDDFIECDYLENFHIENQRADLFVQGFKRVKEEQIIEVNPYTDIVSNNSDLVCVLEENNLLNSPCYKLYKSSIIKNNHLCFKEGMSYGEDHLFTFQYMEYARGIKYNNGCKYIYFLNAGDSLSRSLVSPESLIYYVNVIIPELEKIFRLYNVDEMRECVIANRRVHFNLLMATNNNAKGDNRIEVFRSIKESLINNMHGYVGLTRNQSVFVWVVKHINIFILAFLMKINSRFNLTGKLKLGF